MDTIELREPPEPTVERQALVEIRWRVETAAGELLAEHPGQWAAQADAVRLKARLVRSTRVTTLDVLEDYSPAM
jgi:hypothetical protein